MTVDQVNSNVLPQPQLAKGRDRQMGFRFLVVIAALGGLLFGYNTGVISGALLFIRTEFDLSPTMQGVVVGVALVGAAFGAAFAGSLADRFGRRLVLLVTGIVFVVGAAIAALAPTTATLLAGRASSASGSALPRC